MPSQAANATAKREPLLLAKLQPYPRLVAMAILSCLELAL